MGKNNLMREYEHMAFGRNNDIVALLYADSLPADIGTLDLDRVSGIKRGKDGSIEIKLVDRLAALDRLSELRDGSHQACNLYRALGNAAASLPEITGVVDGAMDEAQDEPGDSEIDIENDDDSDETTQSV